MHVSVYPRFEQRASLDGPLPPFQIREVIGDVVSIASARTMIPSPSHRANNRPMRGTWSDPVARAAIASQIAAKLAPSDKRASALVSMSSRSR